MDGKKTNRVIRRRLKRLEKVMSYLNLLLFVMIFVFMVGLSMSGIESVRTVSYFGCSLLLISGFLNLIYWIIWERFNSR